MSWKQSTVEFLSDALRFSVRACLLVDGILMAVLSVWFVWRFVWHVKGWLARVMFDSPW